MAFNFNTIDQSLLSNASTFTTEESLTEENVNAYISAGNFTNPSDLSIATLYLQDKLNSINADLDPNNPTSKQSLLNTKNIELADVEGLINITNQQLNSKQTELNGVLGQISEYTDDFNEIKNDLADIEAQLDARTEELSNRLQQEGVSLSTIKTTLNNFKTAQTALNQVLANPTVNLYASGTKKIIPFKKRIKLFLTLNGKEQWASPPTVQFISISALVSSKLKEGTTKSKYSRAGRWREITKSLKPKLAKEEGRYYIELDTRGLADFPADYFDEFVIRYDNLTQWSGEVLRWSWGAGATVGSGAGLVQTAGQLTASMEQIVDILDELLGEGGSTGSTTVQNLPNFGNLPQL